MFTKTEKQQLAVEMLSNPTYRDVCLSGGARAGKTMILLYAIIVRALKCKNSTHCIIRRYFRDCRQKIGLVSFPQIMELAFPEVPFAVNKADWILQFPNGSNIWLCGLDDEHSAEKILGNEFSTIFFNEISELHFDPVQQAKTRLAQANNLIKRSFYDLNPTNFGHWAYKIWWEHVDPKSGQPLTNPDRYAYLQMNPVDNAGNIDADYVESLKELSERQRQRFLLGEWQEDETGKLFRKEWIESNRVTDAPVLDKIVVAVDPAITARDASDETGIVVAGISGEHVYILDDYSIKGTPAEWAARAVTAYERYQANEIVAETNQGGDMVEATIQQVDRFLKVTQVRASRGKDVRAEPIAAMYERGKIHHAKNLDALEEQLVNFDPMTDNWHDDRVDAMVWAVTALVGNRRMIRPVVAGESQAEKQEISSLSVKEVIDNENLWHNL